MTVQPYSIDLRSLQLFRRCGQRTVFNTVNVPIMHAWLAVQMGPVSSPHTGAAAL